MNESATAETAAPQDEATHPAGEIRLSPARSIVLRVSALSGLAVGAIVAAGSVISGIETTSGP